MARLKRVRRPTANKENAKTVSKTGRNNRIKDGFTYIKGIGPQNEGRLNNIGAELLEDIAKWAKTEQTDIGQRPAFLGRIERDE